MNEISLAQADSKHFAKLLDLQKLARVLDCQCSPGSPSAGSCRCRLAFGRPGGTANFPLSLYKKVIFDSIHESNPIN